MTKKGITMRSSNYTIIFLIGFYFFLLLFMGFNFSHAAEHKTFWESLKANYTIKNMLIGGVIGLVLLFLLDYSRRSEVTHGFCLRSKIAIFFRHF